MINLILSIIVTVLLTIDFFLRIILVIFHVYSGDDGQIFQSAGSAGFWIISSIWMCWAIDRFKKQRRQSVTRETFEPSQPKIVKVLN